MTPEARIAKCVNGGFHSPLVGMEKMGILLVQFLPRYGYWSLFHGGDSGNKRP